MTDPAIYMANRDVTDEKEGIHTHYNDDIKFELDSPSLVGRTDEGRGAAQKIVAVAPLTVANGQLSLDLGALGDHPDDAAAEQAGVPVAGLYRSGGALRVRVA
jgi:hypothetical protein